ncbi:hypothetical protein [Wenyingzhuangia sp. IMCC45574]
MKTKAEKDISSFTSYYKKFSSSSKLGKGFYIVSGEVDVIDEDGVFRNSYKISIILDPNYPNSLPKVKEVSNYIERDEDFHISKEGFCCLEIPHELHKYKRQGYDLISYYKDYIYPYFVNHQYKLSEGSYANGEYEHFDKGVVQYYRENFHLSEPKEIVLLLKISLNIIEARRNSICPICGKGKFKKCCGKKLDMVKFFDKKSLLNDLLVFQKLSDPS